VGVAHAPDVSLTAADGRAHSDTGGTKRRPLHREVAHSQEHRPVELKSTTLTPPRFGGEPRVQKGGTQLPSLCSPCFSSIEVQ
jgi:hypothetical protein